MLIQFVSIEYITSAKYTWFQIIYMYEEVLSGATKNLSYALNLLCPSMIYLAYVTFNISSLLCVNHPVEDASPKFDIGWL